MMRSKTGFTLFLTALLLAGCSDKPTSAISGKEAIDGPLIAVKIDDTDQAHPQEGIDKADLIFIEQVEGGLVRLAALFSTEIPDRIGPIRSARISDLDLLAQFGKVAFFYSGAQSKLLPLIDQANLHNLGAQRESPKLYSRDANRFAPFDMILVGSEVKNRIASLDVARASNIGWSFGDLSNKGIEVSSAQVNWPAANYIANWNGQSWDLLHNGKANLTSSGIQISPSTFIIQKVVITNSEFVDKTDSITPLSITVGEGEGWVLRDGVAIKARWNRPDPLSGTTWSDLEGNEIKFARGQIWIALTDTDPEFTTIKPKK
ncbi:MAG: DUF3048 domain-containing protein [Candidatus Nanopelagicaceae bacterium]